MFISADAESESEESLSDPSMAEDVLSGGRPATLQGFQNPHSWHSLRDPTRLAPPAQWIMSKGRKCWGDHSTAWPPGCNAALLRYQRRMWPQALAHSSPTSAARCVHRSPPQRTAGPTECTEPHSCGPVEA